MKTAAYFRMLTNERGDRRPERVKKLVKLYTDELMQDFENATAKGQLYYNDDSLFFTVKNDRSTGSEERDDAIRQILTELKIQGFRVLNNVALGFVNISWEAESAR